MKTLPPKSYISSDSTSIIFLREHYTENYRNGEQIRGCQALGPGEEAGRSSSRTFSERTGSWKSASPADELVCWP